MHTNYIHFKNTKIQIKTLKNVSLRVSVLFKDHLQGARGQYFVKLPSWDLLIYVRYGIVRFAAICHYNPTVYVSGDPYWIYWKFIAIFSWAS
jgi:hypothetical protein